MKRIFFLTTALILGALFRGSDAQATNLPGIYSISRGVGANNSEYTGKVKILGLGEDRYELYWRIPDTREYQGIGLLDHGKLCVAYSSNTGVGLVIYKIDGGKLSGKWFTTKTELEPGYENLQGPPGLNGTYQIVEAQADDMGDKYSGTLVITSNGEIYYLIWNLDDGSAYTGVGLLDGNYLVAAWGPEAGIMSYDIKGNELLGHWAGIGANKARVENLVRMSPQNRTQQ